MANGVYWIGQDGNTYVNGDITNGSTVKWSAPMKTPQQLGYLLQDDPVNPTGNILGVNSNDPAPVQRSQSSAPTPPPIFNDAAARNTQMSIDQLPGLLASSLAEEQQRFDNTERQFNDQEAAERAKYDESVVTNQKNYDANYMDSIRAGIKGLGGLFNILRGTGAYGGSVNDDVRELVGGITADDIRNGADTRNENQAQLDSSINSYLAELAQKRRQNRDTVENNQRAIKRDNATKLQELYGTMAGLYGDAERTAERDDWMSRAGALTPEIAANSRTQVSSYDTTPATVRAPELSAFAESRQPNSIEMPSNGQIGAGIFSMNNRRRNQQSISAGA